MNDWGDTTVALLFEKPTVDYVPMWWEFWRDIETGTRIVAGTPIPWKVHSVGHDGKVRGHDLTFPKMSEDSKVVGYRVQLGFFSPRDFRFPEPYFVTPGQSLTVALDLTISVS